MNSFPKRITMALTKSGVTTTARPVKDKQFRETQGIVSGVLCELITADLNPPVRLLSLPRCEVPVPNIVYLWLRETQYNYVIAKLRTPKEDPPNDDIYGTPGVPLVPAIYRILEPREVLETLRDAILSNDEEIYVSDAVADAITMILRTP